MSGKVVGSTVGLRRVGERVGLSVSVLMAFDVDKARH